MWGTGGRYYWGRKENREFEGIVVLFAWLSSDDKHLKHHVDFYASLRWNSLVCHSQFLNLFFPDKAAILALGIVDQLVQEIKLRPCPVVFVSFSGGPKACMYKVLQIIEGKCQGQVFLDEYQIVRDCVSGYIFDSTPVDFISDIGARFLLHPTVLKMSQPPPLASWIARSISSCLDALFLSRFESDRAEYWQTLYATIAMKSPYLIFASEDDDLAPFQVIYNFASRLRQLGGDIALVQWKSSPHVGHIRVHPDEYKAAVTELLHKAVAVFTQRRTQQEKIVHKTPDDQSCNPRNAAANSSSSFNGMAMDSSECYEGIYLSISAPPETKIVVDGVLGKVLFEKCVPRNIEDWDMRHGTSRPRHHQHFNPIKCLRRSRL